MLKIDDNFCGYLNIGDDKFVFNISNSLVTLLPAESDHKKIQEVLSRIRSHNNDVSKFIFGYDGNGMIALECNTKFNMDFLQLSPIIKFKTPIIIKAVGNTDYFRRQLTADWDHFHSITFWGGNINAIFPPSIARKTISPKRQPSVEGTIAIELHPSSYYTRSTQIEIDGTKAILTVSLIQTEGNNEEHMNTYNIGELSAFIRLSFEEAQYFGKIERYYQIVHSLIAVLTAQNNIVFNVYISQKGQDGLFYKTGVCKIFDGFPNYSARKNHKVIPILSVFDHIPNMIKLIASGKVQPILEVLPRNNADVYRISITNVQDLCTALEIEYNTNKPRRPKDALIEELKKSIHETITDFVQDNSKIDIYKSINIASAFKYMDFTLVDKIFTLYGECESVVNGFIAKKSLLPIDESRIRSFVKLRNEKTHSGEINWGDNDKTYTVLLALLYACMLKNVGVDSSIIQQSLANLF